MHFSEFVEQSNGFYTYFILWSASSEKYYPKGVQCKGNTIAINVQDTITYFMICIITHSRMKEKPYRIYKMRDRETKLNSLLRTFQTKLFTAIATATTLLQWMHVCVKCIHIQTISNDGFFRQTFYFLSQCEREEKKIHGTYITFEHQCRPSSLHFHSKGNKYTKDFKAWCVPNITAVDYS